MKHYEIRVLNADGKTNLIFHALHLNDFSAIQAAKKIAGDRAFDLWCGMDCIFAGSFRPNQMMQ